MNNHFDVKDSIEFFVTKNVTRYLRDGSSERCICSRHVTEHKTIGKTPFYAICWGNGKHCPCHEYVPYRHINQEIRP